MEPITFEYQNGHGCRIGRGWCAGHHGELFQGAIAGDHGTMRRCLMTLPCDNFQSSVSFFPDSSGELRVDPPHKEKARRTVQYSLDALGFHYLGGVIVVRSNITECKGYGSSTADCVAAALAVADALRVKFTAQELARLVVDAEQASDNLMFCDAVLFAHREGVVIDDYARPVPRLELVAIDSEPDRLIDTLDYTPASYSWKDLQYFEVLVTALRRAVRTHDLPLLGQVATASAGLNQRVLPKPGYADLRRLARERGALGVAVAHSGTVMSVLLDPDDPAIEHKIEALHLDAARLGLQAARLTTRDAHAQRRIA
jgi:uncharacterized protein involved in propanediol utilization